MERRDLIKDEIERLGKVLGKIVADLLKLKANGETNEGIEATEQALKEELDFNVTELLRLKEDEFIERVTENQNFNFQTLEQLGDVFFEVGDGLIAVSDQAKAQLYLQKALMLYEHITGASATFSLEREEKVEKIKRLTDRNI